MELDPRRQQILDDLKEYLGIVNSRYSLAPPVIIELTGSPESGKSTTTKSCYDSLRKFGLRVEIPQEGAEVVNYVPRTSPEYNLATFNYALSILLKFSHGHMCDVVIFNRCIFDAYCWMEYWLAKGHLTYEQKRVYQQFILSNFWTTKIDACIFMICDPEEAMRRAMRLSLTEKQGETTNPQSIKTLVDRYKTAHGILQPRYPQLHLVDTTNLNEHQMILNVSDIIFRVFEKKTKTGQ